MGCRGRLLICCAWSRKTGSSIVNALLRWGRRQAADKISAGREHRKMDRWECSLTVPLEIDLAEVDSVELTDSTPLRAGGVTWSRIIVGPTALHDSCHP